MQPLFEESLEDHLGRVERYMDGFELLRFPREHSTLRTELAAFIRGHVVAVVDQWVQLLAPIFSLAVERIPETQQNQQDALLRWARHIENPNDIETYVYLREHARHGFISHSPPSRFLSGQMKIRDLIRRTITRNVRERSQALGGADQSFGPGIL